MATTTKGLGPAVGIDLGTTYSCVAVFQDGEVTIIKNELGKNTTPSHIAFPELNQSTQNNPITVGEAAKNQPDVRPENAIYDAKRMIGRRFDDPELQNDMKHWPFEVIDENNSPRVRVNGNTYHPEQISAKVLAYLKQQAEKHLGKTVTDAVITVPAYFNDGQRQATKDAGSIAGLNVLRIINEPTAAAIAYNHQLREQGGEEDPLKKKNVLIFDLGGGTFDLALLTMEGNSINVKAVDGDTHLGGQDFDNALVDHCIKEFEKKHNVDLSKCQADSHQARFEVNKRLRRIKIECEKKKVNLSAAKNVTVSIEVIYDDLDLIVKVKRETFESINQRHFDRCIEIMDRMLKDAKFPKEEVDDVVLVGGSSRIPKIQEMIKKYFEGKAPCQNIRQDEAVAYGAAVQASQMTTKKDGMEPEGSSQFLSEVHFTDVIPQSIGIKIHVEKGNVNDYSVILEKNTPIPCERMKKYYTVRPNQTSVTISIYEGQNPSVAENHKLGEFHLEDLPPKCPKGEPIDVEMQLNEEGILQVTAECPANKVKKDITVRAAKGLLKPEEIQELRMQELFTASSTSIWGTFTN